ncbi:hypothetical protein ACJMK2_033862 [Sinanodonta woodiana]|uniref:G-protein coupled receptors family 1 profile domain-containing protein n=1 Tax=Sinanodonta woodiana TaxID=1069815 RepID=A0ABD3WTH6_SINWO
MERNICTNASSSLPGVEDLHLEHWAKFPPLQKEISLALGVLTMSVLIVASGANIFIITSFIRYRSLRSSSTILALNLSIADLFMAGVALPLFSLSHIKGDWIAGDAGCRFYGFIAALVGFVTINTFIAMAMNRFHVFGKDFSWTINRSTQSMYKISCLIWILAVVAATLPFMGFGSYVFESDGLSCTFDFFTRTTLIRSYIIFMAVTLYIIPVVLITTCYIFIVIKVYIFEKKHFKQGGLVRFKGKKILNFEKRVAKITVFTIAMFLLSWTPYCLVALIGQFGNASLITPLVSILPGVFAKLSTAFNAVTYVCLHSKLRRKLIVTSCKKSPTNNSVELIGIPVRLNTIDQNQFLPLGEQASELWSHHVRL